MRLAMMTLCAAAMLAGCERTEPISAPTAEEAAAVAAARAPAVAPAPEIPFKRMEPLPTETEQARIQAEASKRELDRTASTLSSDIAGARQQADEAVRRAAPPEPAPRQPEPAGNPAPLAPTSTGDAPPVGAPGS